MSKVLLRTFSVSFSGIQVVRHLDMTFMAVSNRRLIIQRYILSVNHSLTSQPHHLSAALIFCQDGITFGYKLNDSDECGGLNPLIRMQAGKKYQLRLENQAAQPTNIHTHGLHIPGDGNADDVCQRRQKHTLDIFFDRILSSATIFFSTLS